MSYETAITILCVIAALTIVVISFRLANAVASALSALLRAFTTANADNAEATITRLEAALEESKVWEGITKERGDYWRDRYYAAISGEADTEEPIKIHADKLNALDTGEVKS